MARQAPLSRVIRLEDGQPPVRILIVDDVLATDLSGNSLEPGKKPSAETLLHTQLYSWRPEIGAVLHTHSVNATVLSRLTPEDFIEFEDYELQKAFSGVSTHESRVRVPIFDNDQDIARLAAKVPTYFAGMVLDAKLASDAGVMRALARRGVPLQFRSALKENEASLSEDVTPHVLRHTRATEMLKQGVPIWDVAKFLGATVALIESTYGHSIPGWLNTAAQAR